MASFYLTIRSIKCPLGNEIDDNILFADDAFVLSIIQLNMVGSRVT